ncbi:MAG: hypothetical protein PUK83_06850 [Clostridia bacterium]|nr:hypothetical protein [Clostridia bacterium]
MKIKLHPAFLTLVVLYVVSGKWQITLYSVLAVILHETGHLVVAKYFGYTLNKICLMPYGAVIKGDENLDKKAEFYVSIAGPITSLVIALLTVATWWIFPSTYDFTVDFVKTNIAVCFVNLLPSYPLDGARIVLSLSKNRLKSIRLLKVVGILTAILFIVTFIVSCFYEANFSLLIFGLFLLIGAWEGSKKEGENYVLKTAFLQKQYEQGVEEKRVRVSKNVTLRKMLNVVRPNSIVVFLIVDEKGKIVKTIEEYKLTELIEKYTLSTRIFHIYSI